MSRRLRELCSRFGILPSRKSSPRWRSHRWLGIRNIEISSLLGLVLVSTPDHLTVNYCVNIFLSDDFENNDRVGVICVYSLKNPSHPEYICTASSGILCVDIHPGYPHILAVGLYDGNVAVYDLSSSSPGPSYQSSAASGKHADAVWQVGLGSSSQQAGRRAAF